MRQFKQILSVLLTLCLFVAFTTVTLAVGDTPSGYDAKTAALDTLLVVANDNQNDKGQGNSAVINIGSDFTSKAYLSFENQDGLTVNGIPTALATAATGNAIITMGNLIRIKQGEELLENLGMLNAADLLVAHERLYINGQNANVPGAGLINADGSITPFSEILPTAVSPFSLEGELFVFSFENDPSTFEVTIGNVWQSDLTVRPYYDPNYSGIPAWDPNARPHPPEPQPNANSID